VGRAFVLALLVGLLSPAPALAARPFPRGFLWGAALAGFQAEAGGRPSHADPHSDWWVWTHDRSNIDAGRVSGDLPENGPGHWARYRTDVGLAARRLHLGAFRLSIEWSRIFPESTARIQVGRRIDRGDLRRLDRLANHSALRHYLRELSLIRRRGMVSFVTVNHFSLPLWIHDPIATRDALAGRGPDDPLPSGLRRAGWLQNATVREFRKYSAYLAWKLGRLVDYWSPINEPMVVATNGYVNVPGALAGNFPPGVFSFTGAITAVRNLERANTAGYDEIKRWDRRARVGPVQNMIAFTPSDPASARDVATTRHADYLFNRLFLNAAVRGLVDGNADGRIDPGERLHGRKADFVGVNYYFRGRVTGLAGSLSQQIPVLDFLPSISYRTPQDPSAPPCPTTCSEFGSEIYPAGFRRVLATAGRYRLPVYVTENGIADSNDDQRAAYLRSHLDVLRRVIRDRMARVRGYIYWSLTDNLEWSSGYTPKFGLYSFDPLSLHRRARPSARLYARIARRNALPG
jgi:beta-galactosidase